MAVAVLVAVLARRAFAGGAWSEADTLFAADFHTHTLCHFVDQLIAVIIKPITRFFGDRSRRAGQISSVDTDSSTTMTLDRAFPFGILIDETIHVVVDAVAYFLAAGVLWGTVIIEFSVDTRVEARIAAYGDAGELHEFVDLSVAIVIDPVALLHGDLIACAEAELSINTALCAWAACGLTWLFSYVFIYASIAVVIQRVADFLPRLVSDVFQGLE